MPAILPVRAAESYLVLERLAARSAREPFRVVSLEIVGMGCGMPTCSGDFLWPHPAILDKSAVHVRVRAVRQGAPHDRRYRIDHVATFRFFCSDHRFSLTLLRDVGNRSHEFQIPAGASRRGSVHSNVLDGTIG